MVSVPRSLETVEPPSVHEAAELDRRDAVGLGGRRRDRLGVRALPRLDDVLVDVEADRLTRRGTPTGLSSVKTGAESPPVIPVTV